MVVRSPGSSIINIVNSILTIRTFSRSDLSQVAPLVEGTFHENYETDLYVSMSEKWPEGQLVACAGTEVVGYLMASEHRPLQARVLILCVRKDHRGLGIGRALMRTLITRAIIKGCRNMTLEVRISNEKGLAFYAKLGFEMIGLIPKFYSDGESAFLLKKVLQ